VGVCVVEEGNQAINILGKPCFQCFSEEVIARFANPLCHYIIISLSCAGKSMLARQALYYCYIPSTVVSFICFEFAS
jgi:hypothetical protein